MAARGLGRLRGRLDHESAWAAAVGPSLADQTRVASLRHGVLNVIVAHSALLEELAAYRKPEILEALRKVAPGTTIRDVRFRVGPLS
jgi:predicted nucleic acid-binding Zn ribbon protein